MFLKLFSSGALAFSTAYFGQGAGPIILDNVHCNGSESSIMDCNHHYNQSNCAHNADAGVRCQGDRIATMIYINYQINHQTKLQEVVVVVWKVM